MRSVTEAAAVLVPDLAATTSRWPAFTSVAVGLGVGAMFAFPLRIEAISVGVLLAHPPYLKESSL
jgi:hypothetical protein